MTTEQHGSKTEGRGTRQERMTELGREIAERQARSMSADPAVVENECRIHLLRAELSRLRDEGGGEEAARLAEKEAHMDCYQYGKVDGGLERAAEWHEEQATAYDKQSDILDTSGLVAAIHRECAQHFRTLSAKPTAAERNGKT